MPRSRSSMRKIREVLRQKWELGFSVRQIALSCGVSGSIKNLSHFLLCSGHSPEVSTKPGALQLKIRSLR